MLKNRIIPCLDVKNGRVVKGINFVDLKDAGDPVEQAKIYSDGGADEICFLDITASNENRDIIYDVVEKTSKKCFVPLTVGGGIKSAEDINKLLNCGADKVSINTAAVENSTVGIYSSKKFEESISKLKIYNFKLKELPVLTKILPLASLQGIADILSGEGIRFDEFEMNFRNKKNLMTIDEIYAIGPAISILMNGYVEKNKLISLRGTLVPATTINKFIGSLPVLGKILVGQKTGEGVFGVSFKIKGPPKNLETTVNPIKTLTPRFITRTLEKIKKN